MGIAQHYAEHATFYFVARANPAKLAAETELSVQDIAARYIPLVSALNSVAPPKKKTDIPFRLIAVLDEGCQNHLCYIGRISREQLLEHDHSLRRLGYLDDKIAEKCYRITYLDRVLEIAPNDKRIVKGLYDKFLQKLPGVSFMAFRQSIEIEKARPDPVPHQPEPPQKAKTAHPTPKAG